VSGAIWKDPRVARAFLERRSDLIPGRERQLEVTFRLLHLRERTLRRVLDLGAGDGAILSVILEAHPDVEGVAVDFSPPMLEQARARLARFGARARVLQGDLGSSEWLGSLSASSSGLFDAVLSSFAIHHLADARKRTLYREIYDLLDGDGVFLNIEHVASATPRIESAFNDMMVEHHHSSRSERGEDVSLETVRREFMDRPDRHANILAPVEAQCAWLREIGFTDVDCFWKYFELALFGGFRARHREEP